MVNKHLNLFNLKSMHTHKRMKISISCVMSNLKYICSVKYS